MGMGASFEGVAAIRGFFEDFTSAYEEYEVEPEEILDLGNGVTLGVGLQQGRPVGNSRRVQMRFASVAIWIKGAVVSQAMYTDVDEARAAAERLAAGTGVGGVGEPGPRALDLCGLGTRRLQRNRLGGPRD